MRHELTDTTEAARHLHLLAERIEPQSGLLARQLVRVADALEPRRVAALSALGRDRGRRLDAARRTVIEGALLIDTAYGLGLIDVASRRDALGPLRAVGVELLDPACSVCGCRLGEGPRRAGRRRYVGASR